MSTQKKNGRKSLTPTKSSLMTEPKPRAMRSLQFGADTPKKKAEPVKVKTKSIQQEIKDEFYNPKTGLWNANKIYKKLKAKGLKVKLKDVRDVLSKQLVTQVYKQVPQKKKDRFTTIVARYPKEQYQADLLDLKSYAKFNKGFRYLLNVVDVYSRYAYSIPVKTKTEEELIPAFKKVFAVIGKPKNLNTDLESAILGNKFQTILKRDGIKHYQHNPVDDKRNMSIVERFNRTIRDVLVKYFYSRDTKNYIDILPDLLSNYNSTIHRTTKQPPEKIWNKEARNEQKVNVPTKTIKIGDTVRILKRYSGFTKMSDVKKFTKNEYKVVAIEGNTYVVKNAKGITQRRKQFELQKIDPSEVDDGGFKKQGQGKEFKDERKKEKAKRQLAKEDIESDLVNAEPTEKKRVSKPIVKPAPPKVKTVKPKATPKPKVEDDAEVYDIERLIGKRTRSRQVEYLVEWKGYSEDEATWERRSQLIKDFGKQGMKELEEEFKEFQKEKKNRE